MPVKKRKPKAKKAKSKKAKVKKAKARPKKAKAKPKSSSKKSKPKKTRVKSKPKKKATRKIPSDVEDALRAEIEKEGKDLFYPERKWTFSHWVKKYSPVIVTLLIGLATYFYLIFYLFYPTTLLHGHYVQLLLLITFIFLIAGILIYLGLRAELLFVRILSFIFVFVIFTFLLLFILLANTMQGLGI